jgi:aspartokinase/homoserine dehydrogenase 1
MVADFLAAAADLDEPYRRRMEKAAAGGETLRYLAIITDGRVEVGLEEVPLDSPTGRLQGTDNLIAFYTDVYRPTPLVLQGRGAGAQGTAAGVLADIVALARR